ncbi:membrane-spanning 4-domains subfamily A member 4A-like isoform X2 [Oryzias melastigma]|uniref:membrane-spanning 4-domains subfamily A member 4A-like isoform X2 n=1 Tax=Oryzias melastigma TaxID=30732 RepID=UPI00168D5DB9|nr:membrane-spanning 4-domains subfamily A member 4A-like isoform X2 [Oryzias melastigma]
MKNTFVCDESMIITIPVGSIQELQDGQLMPEQFYCVFNDHFKVLVIKGKAQPLGAAQAVFGLLLSALALVVYGDVFWLYTFPSIVFVICGGLSFAAGKYPNMTVAKLSFSLNILSLLWSFTAFFINVIILIARYRPYRRYSPYWGVGQIGILILSLLVVEFFICIFLIYWLSKAICRQHFNTLPTIVLKPGN